MREDWTITPIEKIGDIITGNTPSKSNTSFYSNKDFPFYKPKDLEAGDNVKFSNDGLSEEGFKNSRIAPEGSILVTCIGATIGKTGLIKKTGAFNQQINGIVPFRNIDSKFIYFQIIGLEFQQKIKENASSTTLPILNKSKFSILEINLTPLPIQRAIVRKIENLFVSLDKGIADLKTAQEQLKVYRQAVLKKAFEGGFTNSKMHFLKLINVTTTLGDGLHGTPKYSENGEYYFINGNNLSDGKILIKPDTKRVDKEEFEKYKKDLNQTTVFVSINGTIGNTAFYKGEAVILGKSACYFNVNEGISKEYIRYNLKTSEFINYAIRNATGSTIKNVGLKTMRDYLVPLPINKAEQHAIVSEIESRLSVCDKVEQSISEALAKAEALRQSILKKAFEGKLLSEIEIAKCKQEADYEPASKLLERIKKEKHGK